MDQERFFELLFARSPRIPVTYFLLAANIAAYMLSAALARNPWQIDSAVLLELGANHAPQVMQGQVWRLLSAMFLHGGLLHIALNMFALYQAGQIVERLFGSSGFALIYVAAGLAGNVASIWWNPDTLSVGASGAVFGIYGALLAYLRAQPASLPMAVLKEIRSSTTFFVAYSLFAGFALPGIDNGAHVGGLLAGALLGYGFAQPLAASAPLRVGSVRAWIASLLVVAACAGLWRSAAAKAEESRSVQASARMIAEAKARLGQEEARLDQRAEALLTEARARGLPPQEVARRLREDLVPSWNAQIAMLDGLRLSAGESLDTRRVLVRYAQLRRDAFATLADALEREDPELLARSRQLQTEAHSVIAPLTRRTLPRKDAEQ